jgi:hypothetical protein
MGGADAEICGKRDHLDHFGYRHFSKTLESDVWSGWDGLKQKNGLAVRGLSF